MTSPADDLEPDQLQRLQKLLLAVRARLFAGKSIVLPHGGAKDLKIELSRETKNGTASYIVGRHKGGDVMIKATTPERAHDAVVDALVSRAWRIPDDWVSESEKNGIDKVG